MTPGIQRTRWHPTTQRLLQSASAHPLDSITLPFLLARTVPASARTWSQNQQLSSTCSHGFCRSSLAHSPSQPSRTCIRYRLISCTPHPVGSGGPGQTWWSVSNFSRYSIILTPYCRPTVGKPNQGHDSAEQPSQTLNEIVAAFKPSTTSRPEVAHSVLRTGSVPPLPLQSQPRPAKTLPSHWLMDSPDGPPSPQPAGEAVCTPTWRTTRRTTLPWEKGKCQKSSHLRAEGR